MVVVSLAFTIRADVRDELVAEWAKHVKASQMEAGCINFSLYADLWDPNIMRLYEEWESAEALKAHLHSPHFQAFSAARKKLGENTLTIHSGGQYEVTPIDPAVLK